MQAGQNSTATMKNITITLDETTAAWARVHAAKHNKSVSRLVGEMLQQHMRESREYGEAMRHWLAKKPFKLKGRRQRYPKREELYDRGRLR
jgi:plasmid stability protein